MTTATKAQNFCVKGFIKLPITVKKQFASYEILLLSADLHIGSKTHYLIADEITVTWEGANKGTLHLPIEFKTTSSSAKAALEHAYRILNSNMDKIEVKLTRDNGKTKRWTVTEGIDVVWNTAKSF